jgi:hypothetical protein
VGNISESDLRAIQSNAQYLKMLYLPIHEYLELMQKHHSEEPRNYRTRPVVKCESMDTFRDVVERVVEHKVHRCYMVDSAGKLVSGERIRREREREILNLIIYFVGWSNFTSRYPRSSCKVFCCSPLNAF